MTKKELSRRDFIGGTTTALAGAAAAGTLLEPLCAWAAPGDLEPAETVFSAYHDQMVTGTSEGSVQYPWVKAALDACLMAMSDTTNIADAWQAVFAGITPSSKVAIKINCLNTSVHPQLATVRAIVEGLTAMFGGSFPPGNVSLFDNNLWTGGKVDACFGASTLEGLGIVHGEDTYASGQTVSIGGSTTYVSKYWAESDYAISLAKMSPHQYYAGGLSGVIKNMMGAISTQSAATYQAKQNSNGFHDGEPYTAFRDLWTNYARDNLHLYVLDGLFACRHENESGWARVVKRIIVGRDPAAVDAYNVDVINSLGMSVVQPVTKAVPQALQAAGVGTTSYTLVEPQVALAPEPPTRSEVDAAIRGVREGTTSETDAKALIERYRQQ